MANYVMLVNWTDQGVKNARDTVQRAQAFRADLERRGGRLNSIYWTQGRYDIVANVEVPDEQTAMAAALAISGQGNIRTETLRAFNESEVAAIIQKA